MGYQRGVGEWQNVRWSVDRANFMCGEADYAESTGQW